MTCATVGGAYETSRSSAPEFLRLKCPEISIKINESLNLCGRLNNYKWCNLENTLLKKLKVVFFLIKGCEAKDISAVAWTHEDTWHFNVVEHHRHLH